MTWVYAAALGYLLGSVPFGLILTNLFGAGNLREIGSGNIGATNVLRTGNKGLAAATLLLDGAKGWLAVWLAWKYLPEAAGAAALGAVLGHCFPIWLKFKGGKGVATTMGVALALAWPVGLTYAVVWLTVLALSRISSVAGLAAAMSAPVVAWLTGNERIEWALVAIMLVVLFLHRGNIQRLIAGTEPKVGQKSA